MAKDGNNATWVREPTGGPYGSDDGSSYDNAYNNIDDAISYWVASAVKGDIINIVDEGVHDTATGGSQINRTITGTGYGDAEFGLMMRGVDAAGNPSMATLTNDGTHTGVNIAYFRGAIKYIRIEGLSIDQSLSTPETGGVAAFQMRDAATGPMRVRDCRFKFRVDDYNWAAGPPTLGVIAHSGTPPANFGEISYCLIENGKAITESLASNPSVFSCHHNVIVNKGEVFPNMPFRGFVGAGNIQSFYNNTIYIVMGVDGSQIPALASGSGSSASGDYGVINVYNNVVYVESAQNPTPLGIGFMFNGRSAGSAVTWTGTIDYNILYGGPSVDDADEPDWYQTPFEQGNGGAKNTNDVWASEQAASALFKDTGSTYAWAMSDNGYSYTIPEDLRLVAEGTSGVGGALPGALPAATTDRGIDIVVTRTAPKTNVIIEYTITATNTGIADTNVVVTAAVPSGLTAGTATASAGTYVGDTWTLGAVANGASETLVIPCLVDADQQGQTIVFSTSITGDLGDSNAANDTDSQSITVRTAQINDPESPEAIPFIDTAPIYSDVMKADFNMRWQTKKNRKVSEYIRKDVEQLNWQEMTTRRIVLSTNTTTTVNLGGIQAGEFLLMESDVAVQVGIGFGTTAHLFPAMKAVALVVSDFEILKIVNPSTTEEASILLVVSD